ncbi:MAG: hypothetical protein OXG11_06785 [Chloroflexi bacterium]|nr:hypothetical protein [Chloroflexota bacterium]
MQILVYIAGLVLPMDRIRDHYFDNHEIVYAYLADSVDCCRTGIESVLPRLEELNGGGEA